MQGINSQVQVKEVCDVLEVTAVALGINGKGLVAGGGAGLTSVGGAWELPCVSHSCFKYLNLHVCICTHTCVKTHFSKICRGEE